jgi:hypothetical protein
MRHFLHPTLGNQESGQYYEGRNKKPEMVRHGGIRAADSVNKTYKISYIFYFFIGLD